MKSELYQNYLKDNYNLLSTYNNDLKFFFNKRKNGTNEKDRIIKDSKSYGNINRTKVDDNKRSHMIKKCSKCISKNNMINKNIINIKKIKKKVLKFKL